MYYIHFHKTVGQNVFVRNDKQFWLSFNIVEHLYKTATIQSWCPPISYKDCMYTKSLYISLKNQTFSRVYCNTVQSEAVNT